MRQPGDGNERVVSKTPANSPAAERNNGVDSERGCEHGAGEHGVGECGAADPRTDQTLRTDQPSQAAGVHSGTRNDSARRRKRGRKKKRAPPPAPDKRDAPVFRKHQPKRPDTGLRVDSDVPFRLDSKSSELDGEPDDELAPGHESDDATLTSTLAAAGVPDSGRDCASAVREQLPYAERQSDDPLLPVIAAARAICVLFDQIQHKKQKKLLKMIPAGRPLQYYCDNFRQLNDKQQNEFILQGKFPPEEYQLRILTYAKRICDMECPTKPKNKNKEKYDKKTRKGRNGRLCDTPANTTAE
jgi:hypothetical protein